MGIGGKSGPLDHFLNPLPGRFTDTGSIIENKGYRSCADTGNSGDILDCEV